MRLETWIGSDRDWMAAADFASEAELRARIEWAKSRIIEEMTPGVHRITVDGKEIWRHEIPNTSVGPDRDSQRYGAMGRGVRRGEGKRKKVGGDERGEVGPRGESVGDGGVPQGKGR